MSRDNVLTGHVIDIIRVLGVCSPTFITMTTTAQLVTRSLIGWIAFDWSPTENERERGREMREEE